MQKAGSNQSLLGPGTYGLQKDWASKSVRLQFLQHQQPPQGNRAEGQEPPGQVCQCAYGRKIWGDLVLPLLVQGSSLASIHRWEDQDKCLLFQRPSAQETATQAALGLPGQEDVHSQLRHAVGESYKAWCWGRKGFPLQLGNSTGDAPQACRFGVRCAGEFGDQQAGTLLPLGYPASLESFSSLSWRWRSSLCLLTLHLRLGGCPLNSWRIGRWFSPHTQCQGGFLLPSQGLQGVHNTLCAWAVGETHGS